jgi:pyruvate formate lyase activating enzyme
MLGKLMTIEEVIQEIEQDRSFYNRSGGGMTAGGGEPLAQPVFVIELLKSSKDIFLHTAMETCGHVKWDDLEQAARYLDFIYYDIKHMDPQKHKEITGVSNDLILENAKKLLSLKPDAEVVFRTEIIPGCNDTKENIAAISSFVSENGGDKIELLPYHALGSSKYRQLGLEYELKDAKYPDEDQMKSLRSLVESFGIKEMTGVY